MRFATLDFRVLCRAQFILGGISLRLDDKIEALASCFVIGDDGPIWVIGTQRRVNLEPVGEYNGTMN